VRGLRATLGGGRARKGCTKDGAEGYFRSRPTGLTSGLFHSGLLSEIEIHAKRLPASRSGFAPRPLYPK
jgi:hypothetical protein